MNLKASHREGMSDMACETSRLPRLATGSHCAAVSHGWVGIRLLAHLQLQMGQQLPLTIAAACFKGKRVALHLQCHQLQSCLTY